MDLLNVIGDTLKQTLNNGADAADVLAVSGSEVTAKTRKSELESMERAETHGIGIRAFVGKQTAMVSTTDLSAEALSNLAERVVAMAKLAPEDPHAAIAQSSQLVQDTVDLDLYDASEPQESELVERAKAMEAAAFEVEGVSNSEGAEVAYGKNQIAIATSNGLAKTYQTSTFSASVSIIAGADSSQLERDYAYSMARHYNDLEDSAAIGKEAATRAVKRLGAQKIATAKYPVCFDPRVGRGLVSQIASAINGSTIARKASFLQDAMGEAVCSAGITIINDPHMQKGLSSKPFDGEGLANQKMAVIEQGVLKDWLLDIRSANQLGLESNGCASRGLGSPPSPTASNLYIANGQTDVTSLLGDLKKGIYITDTFGMGVNVVTGDYSQGAAGFWIENGEITTPVSEITIASTMQDMLRDMEVANDLEFRYSINTPTIRIAEMTVAGT